MHKPMLVGGRVDFSWLLSLGSAWVRERLKVGIAETGSGKTLAFLLPGIVHINAPRSARAVHWIPNDVPQNQSQSKLGQMKVSKGRSQPQVGAAVFSIPYMVLGSPFLYQVLILTQKLKTPKTEELKTPTAISKKVYYPF